MKNKATLIKVIGYARVSTDKQESERQKLDIYEFAENQGLAVNRFFVETISSKKSDREIYSVIDEMGKGDILIVTELSRLARSMMELNGIVSKIINEKKGRLFVTTGLVNGVTEVDDSIESNAIMFALGISAQIERKLISERTTSALKAKKAQGVTLGRPIGKGVKVDEAIKASSMTEEQVLDYIRAGLKAEAIGKLLGGIDARTVRAWMITREDVL